MSAGKVIVLDVLWSAQWDAARERDAARDNNDSVNAASWEKRRADLAKSRAALTKLLAAATQAERLIRDGGTVPVRGKTWGALHNAIIRAGGAL